MAEKIAGEKLFMINKYEFYKANTTIIDAIFEEEYLDFSNDWFDDFLIFIKNCALHFKKICIHKWWVFYYCCKAGIPFQGIVHDLSKFSPVEFFENVKYYCDDSSPIAACKEDKGYSNAYLHHKGRNKHHYEYWVDKFDFGGVALKMPLKYQKEMLCDYLGAARAYFGKSFSYSKEYQWWLKKKSNPLLMHKDTQLFIETCLRNLKSNPNYLSTFVRKLNDKNYNYLLKKENYHY